MARSPQKDSRIGNLIGRLGARYTRWVRSTATSVVYDPPDTRERATSLHPYIFAMWHGQFVLMPTLHEGAFKVSAIAARHKDAAAIRTLLGEFDIEVVAGAGANERKRDKGGVYALRTAVKLLKGGSTFSMTADIPPGPARRSGAGIATLSRFSGRPIVPFAVATSRFLVLPTWSRMTINLPYSKIAYVMGEPVWVPGDADEATIEACRQRVEASLNTVTARAYALVGGDLARVTPPASGATAGVAREGVLLKIYRGAARLAGAAAPLLLAVRGWQGKEDASRRDERYGIAGRARPDGPLAWVHAASVGEANAVLPVIERLLAERPELSILLTTGTRTSAELAARRLPKRAMHQYIVFDAPRYVRRFLDHWRPDLAVFAESEIWPNLIIEAKRRGVPLALVNARMSSTSAKRWRRFSSVSRALFSRFDLVLAQNDRLGRTIGRLGARRVIAAGNLKVDAPPPVVDAGELDKLRHAIAGRPLLVAASTHDPEEGAIGDAHRLLAARLTGFLTIIAPRHPARGKPIADMLRGKGFKVALRSSGALPDASTDIYIADTIGELGTLYALADVAFVGGSLVARGGQNPVEAIGHGAVVLTGPNWSNFRDFYTALLRHKGAREVASAQELAAAVEELLTQESELSQMRAGAKTALASLAGALDITVGELSQMLPDDARVARAS